MITLQAIQKSSLVLDTENGLTVEVEIHVSVKVYNSSRNIWYSTASGFNLYIGYLVNSEDLLSQK